MTQRPLRLIPSALLLLISVSCIAMPGPSPTVTATPAPATPQTVFIVATPTVSPASQPETTLEHQRIAVYKQVSPAVVNITTQVIRSNFFWGDVPEEGSGSGFLWDTAGHIVTNYHVVQDAQNISVTFGDEVNLSAQVVGSDPSNDLAVLKIAEAPAGIAPIEVGSSDSLQVGQTAIAIGNPFGQFERTMTDGIVSALNRTIETENAVLRGVIQTDAAINRGNSGGPLLDSSGRLIGVTTAIYSPTGTSAGVGLAIPADKVQRVVPVLIEKGRYPHPWLGIEGLGYELSPALARALDLNTDEGLLIARLYRGSPAEQAGIEGARKEVILGNRRYLVGGDILLTIDGIKLKRWEALNAYLDEKTQVGRKVTLGLLRNAKPIELSLELADTPDSLR